MPIFSDPIFTEVFIAIGVAALWVGTCWVAYILGHRHGYAECMDNVRTKRRARRKHAQDGDIRILNPVEPHKRYAEAESVRIVATHAPRFEEEDAWM